MADKKYNPYDNMLSVLKQSAEALGLRLRNTLLPGTRT